MNESLPKSLSKSLTMFEGWSYSQTFRVIGQSLEERAVRDFSLTWQDEEFVVRGQRNAPVEQRWVDKLLGQKVARTERSGEIHYSLKQRYSGCRIRGEALRKNPDLDPRLSSPFPDFAHCGPVRRNAVHADCYPCGSVAELSIWSSKNAAATDVWKSMAYGRLKIIFYVPICSGASWWLLRQRSDVDNTGSIPVGSGGRWVSIPIRRFRPTQSGHLQGTG